MQMVLNANKESKAVLILMGQEGQKFEYAQRFGLRASNKEVKYGALIQDLELPSEVKAKSLLVYNNSQLVVE